MNNYEVIVIILPNTVYNNYQFVIKIFNYYVKILIFNYIYDIKKSFSNIS